MTFPSDWPRRWWLRPDEVAAYLNLPDRLTEPLVFVGDDTNLWGFKAFGKDIVWSHVGNHHAFGLNDDDPELSKAFREVMAKLTAERVEWTLTKEEQAMLDVATLNLSSGDPLISGRKLRHRLYKDHGIDLEAVAYYLQRLGARYIQTHQTSDGDAYSLTAAGLFASCEAKRATALVLSALTVFSVEYDKDQDFRGYTADQIVRVGELLPGDRPFMAAVMPLLALSEGRGWHDPHGGNTHWVRPADIERLSRCSTMGEFWRATIQGREAERPWLTAPLRLRETVNEAERIARVAEVSGMPRNLGPTYGVLVPSSTAMRRRPGATVSLVSGPAQPIRQAPFVASDHLTATGERYVKIVAGDTATSLVLPAHAPGSGPTPPSVGPKQESKMKYDVALSFAGEDRHYAEELRTLVKAAGFEVFYDNDEEADLWGKNLVDHLADVYANQARYVVFFISEHYVRKEWTTHERQAAQATALKKKGNEYILPIRIDSTPVPGLFSSIAHQDIKRGVPHIAANLIKKLSSP